MNAVIKNSEEFNVVKSAMNKRATYNPIINDIELIEDYEGLMTLAQLQQIVRQANVEYALKPNKHYSYHLFDILYQFNRKEAINFLMVGVGEIFFEAPKELVLSLVGKYFLGDFTKRGAV